MAKKEKNDFVIGVKDAAKYLNVHPNSFYRAFKEKRLLFVEKKLPSQKNPKFLRHQYVFKKSDLDEYLKNKRDRRKIKADENKLFDTENDRWSPSQVARFLSNLSGRNFPNWRIFYWLKAKKMSGRKVGKYWIIKKTDFIKTYEAEKNRIS